MTATAKTVVEVYEILFSEEGRNRINALKLNFQDLTTIIKAAMDLVRGADDEGGASQLMENATMICLTIGS